MNKTDNTALKITSVTYTAVFLSLVIFSALFFSCSQMGTAYRYSRAKMGADIDIRVDISDAANQNSPVAVDIVVVSDERLLEKLKNMSAKEWFEKRDQIQRDYPQDTSVHVWSWEWVPGQIVPETELPWKYNAVGAFVFADYLSPGDHRIGLDPFSHIVLRLREKGFSAENVED